MGPGRSSVQGVLRVVASARSPGSLSTPSASTCQLQRSGVSVDCPLLVPSARRNRPLCCPRPVPSWISSARLDPLRSRTVLCIHACKHVVNLGNPVRHPFRRFRMSHHPPGRRLRSGEIYDAGRRRRHRLGADTWGLSRDVVAVSGGRCHGPPRPAGRDGAGRAGRRGGAGRAAGRPAGPHRGGRADVVGVQPGQAQRRLRVRRRRARARPHRRRPARQRPVRPGRRGRHQPGAGARLGHGVRAATDRRPTGRRPTSPCSRPGAPRPSTATPTGRPSARPCPRPGCTPAPRPRSERCSP